ncbi:MAG: hypothetical protein M5U01_30320 [Ardenticatenaceae bacterium]|nr:hypothetical protein [Ardenticatenaceae bacterium]
MLPQSHVAYTVGAVSLLQKKVPALRSIDYRLVALAAVGPDLIDKPLAYVHFYKKYKSAVLFAHTLISHLALLVATLGWARSLWPYALAFNGHALLDRLWFFPDTWYWPFRGWHFHVWRKRGSEQEDIKLAYWYAFTRRPELWGWELGGLLVALWFVLANGLTRPERLLPFLRTGRLVGPAPAPEPAAD